MNLIKILEKRKALLSLIDDKVLSLKEEINDLDNLSYTLDSIDKNVNDLYSINRDIDKCYHEIMVSDTENISDIFSHADCLEHKTEILKSLLLIIYKYEIESGKEINFSIDSILSTIEYYEDLKNKLLEKIKNISIGVEFNKWPEK